MLNIDRPLDDIIKESIQAKRADRADRAARRRDQVSKRKTPAPKARLTPAASNRSTERSPEKDTSLPAAKARRSISKKRKNRRKPNVTPAAPADAQTNARSEPAQTPTVADTAPHYLPPSAQRRSNGVKVVVSNLHPGVTQSDIAELFETVGPLKSAVLPRYQNGTSSCEAEVIFENMPDALEAIKRYNLVPLDNQPLQITLVTTRSKNGRENPSKKSQPAGEDYRDRSRSPENDTFDRKESPSADRNRNGQQGRRNRRRNRRQIRTPGTGANQERDERDRPDGRDGYAD
ncbi:unnamed protein product [Agarophyton chilense]